MLARLLALLATLGLFVASLPILAGPAGQVAPAQAPTPSGALTLRVLGSYAPATRAFDAGAAEIVAYDPATRRMFIVNGQTSAIDIVDISDPSSPSFVEAIAIAPTYGGGAQSVAVKNGIVAVAVQAAVKTDPGSVVFFDADGAFLRQVTVGALPDMVTFTPDGSKVLTANEGEPNDLYAIDPEGSVSIIDIAGGVAAATVTTVGFTEFNAGGPRAGELPADVRIYGRLDTNGDFTPDTDATVAQDLEPEYISLSADGSTAYVTLQENNALAIIDVEAASVSAILALGFKDHSLAANALDASDRDGDGGAAAINITTEPIFGMYQPDAIASFTISATTYLITANEGDARVYPPGDIDGGPGEGDIFNEELRLSNAGYVLDPTAFPNAATLKTNGELGRLNVTNALGDTDGDGDFDRIYAYGARSFSVWNGSTGALVYDSGDDLEQITAAAYPQYFNAGNTDNDLDSRSDNKGPEPEAVAVGYIGGVPYAFVGLERIGGIMVFDLSDPAAPAFVQYINNRDFSQDPETQLATAGDLGPEGLTFVPATQSPTGEALLLVANEISGTTTIYGVGRRELLLPAVFRTSGAE